MASKFRKEKYIKQYKSSRSNQWSFRVRYKGTDRIFNERDYLSSSQAFREAVEFRNRLLVEPIIYTKKTVEECFVGISDIYPLRYETKRKQNLWFNKYISHHDTPISDIKMSDIIQDLNRMVDECSNDMINRVLSIWKKIFGVAIAKGYVSKDITLQIKAPSSHKISQSKRQEITNEQILTELSNIIENSLILPQERNQARNILFTLFYTGMRPCEMFALNKTDVDLHKKTITINKEIGSNKEKNFVIRQCKTEMSNRVIPISSKLIPILTEQLKTKGTYLFDNNGKFFNVAHLGIKYHNLAKENDIDFHFYQCRHTFITRLFMGGVDLKTIQKLVGQKIDATTIDYVRTDEDRMRNAINLM